jgi:hypothetical protein
MQGVSDQNVIILKAIESAIVRESSCERVSNSEHLSEPVVLIYK